MAVGPLGEASVISSRYLASRARLRRAAVHPERLAAGGIHGDSIAARPGREVENAADHQGRDFPVMVGEFAEVVGVPLPGDLEFADVGGVDLIERGILGRTGVAAVEEPFAVYALLEARHGCRARIGTRVSGMGRTTEEFYHKRFCQKALS